MYLREIPRDLFNESKLLKCLGQLALLIHDGVTIKGLEARHSGTEFRIDQRQCCGGLYVGRGLIFVVKSTILELYSIYNSKSGYPLVCMTPDGEIHVFYDDGALTEEFRDYVTKLAGGT